MGRRNHELAPAQVKKIGCAMPHTLARAILVLLAALVGITVPIACHGSAGAQTVGSAGGAFELIDHTGKPFSSATLAGQPYAIFFGFTQCPDVCPTTLLQMSHHLATLGPKADRLKVLLVTVDPQRDTPALLRQYLASFDSRIIGLTGTETQIAATAKAWNAFYDKLPELDGSYTIVHSAYVYLMDRNNKIVATLGFNQPEAEQIAKLQKLLD
jgi:protein SCO1/2